MKKIFLTLVISLAVIFTTQILEDNPVFAQDVYVSSTGGLDFFVDTNTITVAGEADGTVYYTSDKVETANKEFKKIKNLLRIVNERPAMKSQVEI